MHILFLATIYRCFSNTPFNLIHYVSRGTSTSISTTPLLPDTYQALHHHAKIVVNHDKRVRRV
jgi:hypothetical protein